LTPKEIAALEMRGTGYPDSSGPWDLTQQAKKIETGLFQQYGIGSGVGFLHELRTDLRGRDFNIDIAARLVREYLNQLCKKATGGEFTKSFERDIIQGGCEISDYCCLNASQCSARQGYNAPECLLRAMGAIWNAGPRITSVEDIRGGSPNTYFHADYAGLLDGVFDP
jgi:hypothetical protein